MPDPKRTCGNCRLRGHVQRKLGVEWMSCHVKLPMWAMAGSNTVHMDTDATHCAAWTKQPENSNV